ncbi:MAG: transglutaminase domain-containing protein [Bacteroidetes bacterium]|nr:transglutaminase domain-containing protein [Bacteroidota bacterium]
MNQPANEEVAKNTRQNESDSNQESDKHHGYSVVILGLLAAILTMPLFMLLYKYVPALEVTLSGKVIRLDHIILFLLVFFATYYLLRKFRTIVYIGMVGGLLVLTVTNFSGVYTMENLYHDYAQFLYNLSENSFSSEFMIQEGEFGREAELREAIDYDNPEVRNYAASIGVKHFDEKAYLSKNRKWVQFFSVFKEIYGHWKYVFDPVGEEYYSRASETLGQLQYDDNFKGDCDDYSIMMAACIKAIGGEVRLVRTFVERDGKRSGHMYPEVKFGDSKDLETVVYLIKNVFFVDEAKGKSIFYYEDNKGFIWLNFDYNDAYPGGKFQSDVRETEIVI